MVARPRGSTRPGRGGGFPAPSRPHARWPIYVLVPVLAILGADLYRLLDERRVNAMIAAYGAIAPTSEPELRTVRHFNLANLYLERAAELERSDQIQPAMSLVELAKQNYREILAGDPRHWDSRHNLSRALEMLPDVAAVDYENERNPERSPQAPQAARTYEGLP